MPALSGWQADTPLYDPMCGSGTLRCEAMMTACRIPAGFLRSRFGFQRLPDFDPKLWRQVKTAADAAIRPLPPGCVAGSDIDRRAAARANCRRLPVDDLPDIQRHDFKALEPLENTTLVSSYKDS